MRRRYGLCRAFSRLRAVRVSRLESRTWRGMALRPIRGSNTGPIYAVGSAGTTSDGYSLYYRYFRPLCALCGMSWNGFASLSRRKHGFESRRERQGFQRGRLAQTSTTRPLPKGRRLAPRPRQRPQFRVALGEDPQVTPVTFAKTGALPRTKKGNAPSSARPSCRSIFGRTFVGAKSEAESWLARFGNPE
jgi:hypothetical protein